MQILFLLQQVSEASVVHCILLYMCDVVITSGMVKIVVHWCQ